MKNRKRPLKSKRERERLALEIAKQSVPEQKVNDD